MIQRLDPATPLPVGGQATIDIEIIALNLVSVSPITISPVNDQWDLIVDLPFATAQPGGTMTIDHQNSNGGTFDSSQGICPQMTFTRTTPPFDVQLLDLCNDLGDVVVIGSDDDPWSHNVQLPLICPNSSSTFTPVAGGTLTGPWSGAVPTEEAENDGPSFTPIGLLLAVGVMGAVAMRSRQLAS